MIVSCPVGSRPGDALQVTSPTTGQLMQVAVPPGVAEGTRFAVALPAMPVAVAQPMVAAVAQPMAADDVPRLVPEPASSSPSAAPSSVHGSSFALAPSLADTLVATALETEIADPL